MPTKKPEQFDKPLLKHRQEQVRAQIQAGVLVDRLHKIGTGAIKGDAKALNVQVAAAKVLLAKSLPDLSQVSVTGDDGGPLQVVIRSLAGGEK